MADVANARGRAASLPAKALASLRLVARHPGALTGLSLVTVVVFAAIFAPGLATVSPNVIDMGSRFEAPGSEHLLGTDNYGRDVLSRLVFGARVSLTVGLGASVFGGILGVLIGLTSAYFRGTVELVLMRLVDILLSFPSLILALGIMAITGPGISSVIIAVGIASTPVIARVVRAASLTIREQDYVLGAKGLGASDIRIISRHLLPNVLGAIIILGTLNLGSAILVESSLSFLGLGPGPDVPTWGSMIAEGRAYLRRSPWMSIFPGVAITTAILGFNLLGDGLRDLLDPRIKELLK